VQVMMQSTRMLNVDAVRHVSYPRRNRRRCWYC
jgi:hypothetical protein